MNKCTTCGWIGEDASLRPGGRCGSCDAAVRKVTPADLKYTKEALATPTTAKFDIEKVQGLEVLPVQIGTGKEIFKKGLDDGPDMRDLLRKLTSHPEE